MSSQAVQAPDRPNWLRRALPPARKALVWLGRGLNSLYQIFSAVLWALLIVGLLARGLEARHSWVTERCEALWSVKFDRQAAEMRAAP